MQDVWHSVDYRLIRFVGTGGYALDSGSGGSRALYLGKTFPAKGSDCVGEIFFASGDYHQLAIGQGIQGYCE